MPDDFCTVHIPMIGRFEILTPPPMGHLGCYAIQFDFDEKEFKTGRAIKFFSVAGLEAEGIITDIELPGSCIRKDMLEFKDWYKIHWTPLSKEMLGQNGETSN